MSKVDAVVSVLMALKKQWEWLGHPIEIESSEIGLVRYRIWNGNIYDFWDLHRSLKT